MMYESKIVLIIRQDLPTWQKLNVAAFLASSVAIQCKSMKTNYKTVNLYTVFFLMYTICFVSKVYGQSYSLVDRTKLPFFMCGKYKVDDISVTPRLSIWEGKAIETSFQTQDTTLLGEYLKKVCSINEYPTIYVRDTSILYVAEAESHHKLKILAGTNTGTLMPHTVRHSQSNLGHMVFKVPIMILPANQFITAYLTFPEMEMTIEAVFRQDKADRDYTLLIKSHMTHSIDYEDRTKFVPIQGIK